jgi:ribonuclease P protein component
VSLAAFQRTSKIISMACLAKHAKLLKAIEYKYVFDKPVRSSDRYFTVLARPNTLLHARLGLAFTRKRVKLAVARNRLKRIARESFRLLVLGQPGQNKLNADCIILAGPQCLTATNQQLFHSLENHWRQLNKKCEKLQ